MDSAVNRINHYPANKHEQNQLGYPVDSATQCLNNWSLGETTNLACKNSHFRFPTVAQKRRVLNLSHSGHLQQLDICKACHQWIWDLQYQTQALATTNLNQRLNWIVSLKRLTTPPPVGGAVFFHFFPLFVCFLFCFSLNKASIIFMDCGFAR